LGVFKPLIRLRLPEKPGNSPFFGQIVQYQQVDNGSGSTIRLAALRIFASYSDALRSEGLSS
jgi:hypothetical protein